MRPWQLKLEQSRKETSADLHDVSWCCSLAQTMMLCHASPATSDESPDTCPLSLFPSKFRPSTDVLLQCLREHHLTTTSTSLVSSLKHTIIYIAPFILLIVSKRSDMDHTVLPVNCTIPAFPSYAFTRWRHL